MVISTISNAFNIVYLLSVGFSQLGPLKSKFIEFSKLHKAPRNFSEDMEIATSLTDR